MRTATLDVPEIRPAWIATVVVALALVAGLLSPASAQAGVDPVVIQVVSNRADLLSGGNALVEVVLPDGADLQDLRVDEDGRDVSDAFARSDDGRILGLVEELDVGPNVLTARIADGRGATITLTNHPIGGPVFSGPQVQPWVCETQESGLGPPQDEQCNAPSTVDLLYKSSQSGSFESYDPDDPPPDDAIAQTTTDEGMTVSYIVRRERGTINRSIYAVAVLYDPDEPWTPLAPQPAWNDKLYYFFSGGAAPQRRQGNANDEVLIDLALSRGYAVAYAALNRFGYNTNSVTSAETVMMVKEHVVETLGPIRYTISEGNSGGSMQQQLITEAYPGLLDGIRPSSSFQDIWTTNSEAQDCSLLLRYFTATSPHLWASTTQQAAVFGNQDLPPATCRAWVGFWLDQLWINPVTGLGCAGSIGVGPGTPQTWAYHPVLNPAGARCTLQDHQVAVFGRRPPDVWTGPEQAAGGFANRPYDNVGVQYGLEALENGQISVEQFLDVNEKIGGRDIDGSWQADRSVADPFGLTAAYRTGQVNSGRGMATVPVIDHRTCQSIEIHSCFHTWVMRARLQQANGHSDNHVVFPTQSAALSLDLLDAWLAAIHQDPTDDPLEVKVARHRPTEAVDTCWLDGGPVTDVERCRAANPFFGDPRIAAGAPLTDDVLKCQLTPLDREDHSVEFTDVQWTRLQAAFPAGVCDWARPGVGHGASVPWLTFQHGPGGAPLGAPPTSMPFGTEDT